MNVQYQLTQFIHLPWNFLNDYRQGFLDINFLVQTHSQNICNYTGNVMGMLISILNDATFTYNFSLQDFLLRRLLVIIYNLTSLVSARSFYNCMCLIVLLILYHSLLYIPFLPITVFQDLH